jgi:hypothetical protein
MNVENLTKSLENIKTRVEKEVDLSIVSRKLSDALHALESYENHLESYQLSLKALEEMSAEVKQTPHWIINHGLFMSYKEHAEKMIMKYKDLVAERAGEEKKLFFEMDSRHVRNDLEEIQLQLAAQKAKEAALRTD